MVFLGEGKRTDAVLATLPAPHRVEAPRSAAREGEVEEHEAEEDGRLALVQEREEAVRRVRDEIGEGHLAGEDEGDRPREEPERQQDAADDLENAGEPLKGESGCAARNSTAGKPKNLAVPCSRKSNAGHDAEHAEHARRPGGEEAVVEHRESSFSFNFQSSWDLRRSGLRIDR